ncbi:response regulator [Oligoflexia bacterium]|nr:response regulator [Oligoflexia bacterium]
MSEKVLFVDDEPNILTAFTRQLRKHSTFSISTATGGKRGLALIEEQGPFAVVVSDMRMPGMDGIEFLGEVRKVAPNTVRMMLTGNTDQETAVTAVNKGNIFRFLTKPCSTEDLANTVEDAIKHYRLITAEKDLLQNTLSGSIKVLTDILSITDPAAFGQNMSLRDPIRKLAKHMNCKRVWEMEFAAMLADIGCISVPAMLVTRLKKGQPLIPDEEKIVERIPEVSSKLLANIPRLENVSKIVLYQNKHFDGTGFPADKVAGEDIPLGARILKVVKDHVTEQSKGCDPEVALNKLSSKRGWYDPAILEGLAQFISGEEPETEAAVAAPQIIEIQPEDISIGQKLLTDLETTDGVLLIPAGVTITEPLIDRMRNYAVLIGLKGPIKVECDNDANELG